MSTSDDRYVRIDDGETQWRFEREFLTSNWRCTFGDGCKGILAEDATDLQQGCCSLGAHFGDGPAGQEEARQISAFVAMLEPDQWQFHDVGTADYEAPVAADGQANDEPPDSQATAAARASAPSMVPGFFGDAGRTRTRVVEGACVFLNRPGFAGGGGCALHIAAVAVGDSPTEWKPSVCWQLPLRVDWALVDDADPDGPETATVRRWSRADWGAHGTTMNWCCTERSEGGEAYSGGESVVVSMSDELEALAGHEVYVQLTRKLAD